MMLKMLAELLADREYIKKTLNIAIPVTLNSVMGIITNFIDTMMVGKLGEAAIAGVGLANKVFFTYTLLVFGITSGISILVSQYWGNRDKESIRRVLGIGIVLAMFAALAFTSAALINPYGLMKMFTNDPDVIYMGVRYLSVVCFSYPLRAIISVTVSTMRATGVTKPAVVNSAIAIVVNTVLNYVLIFGKFGFPALGVTGAAIATISAIAIELLYTLISVRRYHTVIDCKLKYVFSFDLPLLKQFFKTALPVVLNEFLWGFGTTMYSTVYGRMGESAAAAMTVANTYTDIEIVAFHGLSTAALVILGNELGAGKMDDAERHSKYFLWLGLLVSIFACITTLILKGPFTSLFTIEADTGHMVRTILSVFAFTIFIRAQNDIILVGILRSGGDTKICALLDIIGIWLIGVPLAFISGLVLDLPIFAVFAATEIEEIVKLVLAHRRYRKKLWLKNLTEKT